jgi:16S rRNA (guanine527-N7)-methyltransferase
LETPGIWLRTICRKNGLLLTDDQVANLEAYVNQLLAWNQKINLISRQDEGLVWQNHILHSISLLFRFALEPGSVIMDLGSGGGLPGLPLKIVLPESEFLLVDSTRKKVAAVADMVRNLGLKNITTAWGRAEDLVKERNLQSHFNYIITRAVAPLKDLIDWSIPFLRPHKTPGFSIINGKRQIQSPALIALKGGDLQQEIEKAHRSNKSKNIETVELLFPGSEEISTGGKKIVIVSF